MDKITGNKSLNFKLGIKRGHFVLEWRMTKSICVWLVYCLTLRMTIFEFLLDDILLTL